MLTPHVTGVIFIHYFFLGIHWVTHGRNLIHMPYPYIFTGMDTHTHGYKILPTLAHAHYFQVGYPRVHIPMGKTAISNEDPCIK